MDAVTKEVRHIHDQESAYSSPWTKMQRVKMFLWEYVWAILCSWTPKPANPWRLFWLRVFGARLYGKPFVHQRARIQIPWNLIMHDRACLGDRAAAYTLGIIELKAHCTIAQEAYLCTGTHAFNLKSMNLVTMPITIGEHAFVGARAFVLPGITIGQYTVIGAGSLVSKDMPSKMICAGQPCKPLRERIIQE
ncbi:MAG: putative colanic acid biosynthesis acetyltransferase [Chitinophagaceae bacterium]|jgi:putative colanic acid biosynthesis acetyltransferase WcaF|nr:MAG: putative colanic acid biosynthesis acetyltransferase [Chitinophagaceae bacterium]